MVWSHAFSIFNLLKFHNFFFNIIMSFALLLKNYVPYSPLAIEICICMSKDNSCWVQINNFKDIFVVSKK